MTLIHRVTGQVWAGLTFCGLLAAAAFLLGYWQGQRALLAKDSATRPISQVVALGQESGSNSPSNFGAAIPQNATPEMREFLENQAKLMAAMQEVCKKQGNGAPDLAAFADFRRQHENLFQRQQQLAEIMGQQQAMNPLPASLSLRIPPNASPQLQSYLTARDKLMSDQLAYMNQQHDYDPQTRMAAMQQWREQNAARFAQVQQLAQAMAQTSQAGVFNPANPGQAAHSASLANPIIPANSTKTN